MAFVLAPLCRETTNGTSGTAVLSLGGVTDASFQTFVAGVGNGNSTDYAIREEGVGWIECRGTVSDASPDTLTRTSILASSNGGSDVTFGASVEVYSIVSHTTLNALAALESLASLRIASNITGGEAAPTGNTLTAILDAILGSTRGEIPYRGASVWAGLSPNKAGYTLQLSSSLDPTWVNVASGGKGGTTGTVASTWQQAVNRATTAALPSCTYSNGSSGVGATLTATANGALTMDGGAPTLNQRLLIKDQAAPAQNGIFLYSTVGTGGVPFVLTRVSDYDQSAEIVSGTAVLVLSGTENSGTAWVMTTSGTVTLGTTAIAWDSLTATLPDCTQGQVLGNAQSFSAPAVPTDLSAMLVAAALNDLVALEALSSTGFAVRTASNTWAQRTITGTSNRITLTDGGGVSGNPVVDISSFYAGQTTITTLGIIGTGTWQGSVIGSAYGGAGTVNGILKANGSGTTSLAVAGTDYAGVATANTFTKGQAVTPVTGGSVSGTVTPDANDANDWTYTLTGATTIANPSNLRAGQTLNFYLTQDGTGSRTITLGSNFKFSGATLPTWSTVAGRSDFLSCRAITSSLLVCSAAINVS
jgi:hypothetical protein